MRVVGVTFLIRFFSHERSRVIPDATTKVCERSRRMQEVGVTRGTLHFDRKRREGGPSAAARERVHILHADMTNAPPEGRSRIARIPTSGVLFATMQASAAVTW